MDPVDRKACPIDDASFAHFLGDLFASPTLRDDVDVSDLRRIPLLSLEEDESSLKNLSNLRAADDDGLCAEMFKYGSLRLKKELLKSFNCILRLDEVEDA